MTGFRAIRTVYSYYLPEIRKIVDSVVEEYPHDIFRNAVPNPGSQAGKLDDFHENIIAKLIDFYRQDLPHLQEFAYRYPTAGSEEGIREFMTLLCLKGVKKIYVFRGEYEGFREVAKTRGMETEEVEIITNPSRLSPGYWFISNPSAIDGMFLPDGVIHNICQAGHKVFYDLSYLGSTYPVTFDLSHPNIVGALISFSKPYGLFYYRIGFTFSREPVPALYANKWFKNVLSLLIADRVLDKISPSSLAGKYKALQRSIVQEIEREHNLSLVPSSTFLLAHLPSQSDQTLRDELKAMIEPFKRGSGYRFCLTPYLLEREVRKK